MKKFLKALIAVVVVGCVVGGIAYFTNSTGKDASSETSEKVSGIQVQIRLLDCTKSKEKVVFEKSVVTETKDLFALLEELNKEGVLSSVIEESEYGPLLTEMNGLKQDMDKGPWLVYESDNNKVCKEQGMCPVLDQVVLEDGDVFTFKFVSSF